MNFQDDDFDEGEEEVQVIFEEIEGNPQISLARVSGNLDSHTSTYFQEIMLDHIDNGNQNLIIDCGELSYISSPGIGSFIMVSHELTDEEGLIVLYNIQPRVQDVFSLVGCNEFFNICGSLQEAVAKVQELLEQND